MSRRSIRRKKRITQAVIIVTVIFIILSILATLFIWARSMKTADDSVAETVFVAELLQKIFGESFELPSIYTIRKLAHFSEYLLLGTLLSIVAVVVKKIPVYFVPPVFSLFVACIDEFVIQRFSYGRGPSSSDVMIDESGALMGMVVVYIIAMIIGLIRKKKRRGNRSR